MQGKGKRNRVISKVLKGIGTETGIVFLVLCAAAWLIQKGSVKDAFVYPLVTLSIFLASLLNCMIASRGGREKQRWAAALPGIALALVILAGGWLSGNGTQSLTFTLLLAACAVVPPLLFGTAKHAKKKRR